MSELAITLLRVGYLLLLWLFVLAALAVLRGDVFGTKITPRGTGRRTTAGPGPGRRGRRTGGDARAPSRGGPTRLVVVQGPLAGTTIPLGTSSVLVGRAPSCTLVLDDDYSSSRHARFFPSGDGWWVEDLGSTNGTVVDGERIDAPVPLAPGTPVRVGQTVIELRR
ncbi:FHA domain-containing protein [Georgenia sp. TF02-10]|uniref:FHA domain-containing protein FhaB/FipA n=1 Tax=Georgenia sp. TF02-10 TaxID=2917725 RepID=UPI001FA80DB3|nr:FHA domain-containing protein [Georgenia sp. TF02-10]UNX54997.1 FHA domain-containing protein [Georgenia sp. TF02-10]